MLRRKTVKTETSPKTRLGGETTGPKPGPTEVVKWFLLLPTDTDHHLPDFPFALTIRRAHETPGSARNVHRSAPNLQEDDAELSDLFYSMQAFGFGCDTYRKATWVSSKSLF